MARIYAVFKENERGFLLRTDQRELVSRQSTYGKQTTVLSSLRHASARTPRQAGPMLPCVLKSSTTLHQAAEKAVAAAAHVERRPRRSQKTTSTAQSARRRPEKPRSAATSCSRGLGWKQYLEHDDSQCSSTERARVDGRTSSLPGDTAHTHDARSRSVRENAA